LLNQGDGLRGEFGTTATIARSELPKEPKALAISAEEGVGLEKRFFPVFHSGSEKDKLKAIRLSKGGLLDLTVMDDQLLPEQSIFGNQFGFTPCDVDGGSENNRIA
jgi:hypothetical protein